MIEHYQILRDMERAKESGLLDPLHKRIFASSLPHILDGVKATRGSFKRVVNSLDKYRFFESLDVDGRKSPPLHLREFGYSLEEALGRAKLPDFVVKTMQEMGLLSHELDLARISEFGSRKIASLVDQFPWIFDVYKQELAGEGFVEFSRLTNPGSTEILIKMIGVVLGVLSTADDIASSSKSPLSIVIGLQSILDNFWTVWQKVPHLTRRTKAQTILDEFFSQKRR